MTQMFSYSNLSTENYAAILSGGHTLNLMSLVELGAAGINYCNGEQARQLIIDNFGWNIFDPGLDCTLAIQDIESYSVFLYPNPTRSILYIFLNQYFIDISICNLLGIEVISSNSTNRIDINSLCNDEYFINIRDGINSTTKKIIQE